jgi:peptidoglycan/xylan/chitin deacetylase (PgdA/CDA1 family)
MDGVDHRSPPSVIALAGVLGGAALGGYLLPGAAAVCPPLRRALAVGDTTASGEGFALTFDDGPHAQGTPAVLEVLRRHGVSATFFLVGEQVQRRPALAAEVLSAGHEVALHCQRHRNLLRLTPGQVRDDLRRARAVIEDATGASPALYRPPYGVLNAAALLHARRQGWRTLLWSHWGRDWEPRATPESIAWLSTHRARAGAVLLLHDGDDYSSPGSWRRTAGALPSILDHFAHAGLAPAAP